MDGLDLYSKRPILSFSSDARIEPETLLLVTVRAVHKFTKFVVRSMI